jgi:hypothetical protein
MVRRPVRVFKRNAVEGHGVVAVGKPAEERLALPESNPVGIEAERARRIIHHFGIVGGGRHEVFNELRSDFGSGGNRFERVTGGRKRLRHRDRIAYRHLGQDALNRQSDGNFQGRPRGDLPAWTRRLEENLPRKLQSYRCRGRGPEP